MIKKKNGRGTLLKTKSLGPVSNLEEHVRPDWWARIFNALYLKTDADVVEDQNITNNEIDLFSEILELSPDHKILDLCCGQARHTIKMAKRGFKNVEGLDRSSYLVQRAKNTAKKEGLNVKIREGEARKLPYPPDTFDSVIIAGNSFGYFDTIHDDLRVLQEVFRVLKPWGKLLIDVTDGNFLRDNYQPRSWEWIDKKLFVCRERSLSVDRERIISREVISHVDKGVIADQFYAERLYTRDRMFDLLLDAGFSDIHFQGEIATDSQRNQDLGMMEKRIIVTALVKKDWTPLKKKTKEAQKNIVVLLGDPNRLDPIKPHSVFDDDDFYTIDKLKEALISFSDYNFTYLNSHDKVIQELMNLKGKADLVFNLCDEGFYNESKKELHVPALLEILGLPYTGSGPQCLAFCYDKSLVRGIAKEMEIPVPEALFIKPEDFSFELPFVFPAIVKPNFGDSSFGITQSSVVNNAEELLNAINQIRQEFGYDKPILVEEFLTGKDLSIGIIGNFQESYTVLPIIEEDYSDLPDDLPKICGYEAKWLPDSPYWQIKSVTASLPDETEKNIIEYCIKLFERLDCKDYSRFDFRLDSNGNPKLLEVNPNPGWCWDGHLAKMAKFAGLSYSEMLENILSASEKRIGLS